MIKKLEKRWQVALIIACVFLCLVAGIGGTAYHQYKVQHQFAGTYYAYVADNGLTHKVRLTIPKDHKIATLKVVDSTQGMSATANKVNRLKINQRHQTMRAIGYPGLPADHYRHVGTTIKLTTEDESWVYYRSGTPAQRQHETKFHQ